jgi:predicted TIM-barrel fold metal-dependent hydrolase
MHISATGALDSIVRGDFNSAFQRLSECKLPVLFVGRTAGAFEVYRRIAQIFPDLNIVIDHMGHVSVPFGGSPALVDSLLHLSSQPRIYVKIALHHQHSQTSYPWCDLIPLQQRLISGFGASRLMWGSNWPMREPTYAQRLEAISKHFPFHSDEDRQWILGGTAAAIWPVGVTVPLLFICKD